MCGIFGYSFKPNKLSAARRAVLATNLARYNDERGGDSWGVVGFDKDGPHVSRGLGDLTDNAYELCEYNTLFAHTRWSSCGETTIKNAHPFKIGNILGAHNGMIHNHEDLSKKYRRKYEVDSMHIFAHLNDNLPFEEMEGYGAIEWIYRDDPKNIHLSKLLDGELAIYGIGDENRTDGIVWSSSYKHLLKALFAAGLNDTFRYEVRRGRVFTINNGELKHNKSMKLELSRYTPPPVEEKVSVPHYWSTRKIDGFRMWSRAYGNDI